MYLYYNVNFFDGDVMKPQPVRESRGFSGAPVSGELTGCREYRGTKLIFQTNVFH